MASVMFIRCQGPCDGIYRVPNIHVCPCCSKLFCSPCQLAHNAKVGVCTACGKTGFYDTDRCSHCQQIFCSKCYDLHERDVWQLRQQQWQQTYSQGNRSYAYTFNFTTGGYAEESAPFSRSDFDDLMRRIHADTQRRNAYVPPRPTVPTIPSDVRSAMKVLDLTTAETPEQVKQAFRNMVKKSSTGDGGYKTDMDKLVKAKERVLSWVGAKA